MVRPLLKWAGGKRQLLNEIVSRIPSKFSNYWEPFLGGAALFFNLSDNLDGHRFILSDINPILSLFYETLRDRPLDLMEYISTVEYGNTSTDYYEARSRFNQVNEKNNPVEKSGLLIYLNRHCFNGLYRVNSRGEFNVPFGSYISPRMPEKKHILAASEALRKSTILNGDFQAVLSGAEDGDFIYLDPPYEPLSKSSNFTSYSRDGFGKDQQARLSAVVKELDSRGILFMLSNSGSGYLEELYSGFSIASVDARRNINSKGSGRGRVKEILVTNY